MKDAPRLPSSLAFRFRLLVGLVFFGAAACGSPSTSQPAGSSNGGNGSGSGGSNGSGGKTSSGGTNGSGGASSGGTNGSGGATSTGGNASGGASSGGANGSGGSATGGSSSGGASGTGGANGGRGGPGGGGRGGPAGGANGGAPGAGGGSSAGSSGSADCPSGAYFCSGFEDAAQPTGTVYNVNASPGDWTRDFTVDTTVKHSGSSSLKVKSGADSGTSGSAYKLLAAPVGSSTFWARFWIRADVDFGGDHNIFAMASPSDAADKTDSVEFAEDVGIAFNTNDTDRWPDGYGRLTSGGTKPYTLAKNTWHCVEIGYDGPGKVQQLFINGMQLINATGYPSSALTFKDFKFGYWNLHGPDRHVWFDDMAVAAKRVGGC